MLRLREAGKDVYGFGEARTAQSLRTACTKFFETEAPSVAVPGRRAKIGEAVRKCKGTDGRTLLSQLAHELPRTEFGYKKLSKLLRDEGFELTADNKYCINR